MKSYKAYNLLVVCVLQIDDQLGDGMSAKFYNSQCKELYPENCSSNNWLVWNDNTKTWENDNTITLTRGMVLVNI